MKKEKGVTVSEAAEICEVTEAAIHARIKNKTLKAWRVGKGITGRWMVDSTMLKVGRQKPGRKSLC